MLERNKGATSNGSVVTGRTRWPRLLACAAVAAFVQWHGAWAAEPVAGYPTKPVRLIVARGFHRGRDLEGDLDAWIHRRTPVS